MLEIPLHTQRLVILRLQAEGMKEYLRSMLDNESIRYLMYDEEHKTIQGATALFEYVRSAYDTSAPIHTYIIADQKTNLYLGTCGYAPYDDYIVECYYNVNKAHTGKGIATEATRAFVSALSKNVNVHAFCHPENFAAHADARKCGFSSIGTTEHKHFGNMCEHFMVEREA